MLRKFIWHGICFAILLSVWGCGEKGAKLQKSVVPPDKTLFETGADYLRKSQYIKARLAFQTLINTYPDSELSSEAFMAIGDSFYDEGGTENLLQAEDQYKNFIVFFPTHPKAADAQLKVISANMKMMRSPDRDPSNSIKAEAAIKTFLQQFPDSQYVSVVRQYLDEVQENLAQHDYDVGLYYAEKRKNFAAARSRFKEITERYPGYSRMDETYYALAQALDKSNNPDEAAIYYGRLAAGFPFSKYFEDSKARLASLGKPVPEVDTQLAAQNQAHLKTAEGFSPLKPFINFAEALGFKGPPDRYDLAVKQVELQKEATARAEAEGAKTGGDITFTTTLKKDVSGQTEQTTVLGGNSNGGNSNGGPSATDKNVDKNKDNGKNKKKTEKKIE